MEHQIMNGQLRFPLYLWFSENRGFCVCEVSSVSPWFLVFSVFGVVVQQVHGVKTDADVHNAAVARAAPSAFAEVESKVSFTLVHAVCNMGTEPSKSFNM